MDVRFARHLKEDHLVLTLSSPVKMRLPASLGLRAQECLTFTDMRADWAYRKFKAGERWFVKKNTRQAFEERLEQLKADRVKNLLFWDDGGYWTYSGLQALLRQEFQEVVATPYPLTEPALIPWATAPNKVPRYYQTEAVEALMEAAKFGPAGVEIGTGLGKTLCIIMLLKRLGLKTVIMAPSTSIAVQIYDELVTCFGKAKVGFFGGGKKEFKKLFTVGIAASLRNVTEGTPAWDCLSRADVFIADESHLCPAETLSKVCFGLVENAAYRFFFSGTQMRGDGLDLLLDAITGPIVYRMTVAEGIERGFLAQINFRMCWLESNVKDKDGNLLSLADANDMTRAHVYYNPELNAKAAEIANKAVSLMGRKTMILVDELAQFTHLLPHLRYEARFAHGGVTKDNKSELPEAYHESDPKQLVADFCAGKFPILVGTSCIVMGTDIPDVRCILYLRAGKSETEVKQGVGRLTRLAPGKVDGIFIDFGISNVPVLEKHALARKKLYSEIYPSYSEVCI